MALDDDIAALSQAPLFNLLDKDALRLVAFASETRSYREGDVLFRRGDRSDGGYVVSRGAIALDAAEDGSPAIFVAGPGSLIGQAALFARIERRATATAREPSAIIRVTPSLMRRVLEEFPDAAAAIHEAMAEELDRLTEGLERVRRQLIAIDGDPAPVPDGSKAQDRS
jgi:CRP-like cAMP-binding protein